MSLSALALVKLSRGGSLRRPRRPSSCRQSKPTFCPARPTVGPDCRYFPKAYNRARKSFELALYTAAYMTAHVARFTMRQFFRLLIDFATVVSGAACCRHFAVAEDCQALLDKFNRTIDFRGGRPSAKAGRRDRDQCGLWPISGTGAAATRCVAPQCSSTDDGPWPPGCGLRSLAVGRSIARGAVAGPGNCRRGAIW